MLSDPTAPIEALRARLPPGWTVTYGIRELRDPDTLDVRMHLYKLEVVTLSGTRFTAEQAVTESRLAHSVVPRATVERNTWARLADTFPPKYPGVAGGGDAAE